MNELMTRVLENEEFGQVRTIVENGEVLFCGADVAKALGYANSRKALIDHCKDVTKRYTLTTGGMQQLSFIPEGDVYRLVVHSRLETAVRFERWLFDEVLPTLRKTGMYAMLPQDYPSALRALADSVEERLSCTTIPHRLQPCDPLPSVETTVFFRSLKIEDCYGTNKENFICGQRTVGYMVGAPACGWVKTGRTPSAGNTEKATNPRENEQVENSVPWFDRDKTAYFHSSRIFDEDGLARIEIGSGRRIDEGIDVHTRKKRPSFSGGTPAFRLLARLTKA